MSAPRIPVEMIAPAFNPATFADRGPIHDLFTRLRQDYPLAIAEVPGYDPHWIVTKFDDVREITRQDDLFHGGDRSKTLISQAGEAMVMEFTGGQHNIFRSLVQLDFFSCALSCSWIFFSPHSFLIEALHELHG